MSEVNNAQKRSDVKPTKAADTSNKNSNTKTRHTETEEDILRARWLAIYTLLLFAIAILSLLSIWPGSTKDLAMNDTSSRTISYLFLMPCTVGPEFLLAATMVLAGFLGACVYSLYAIILHLSPEQEDFDKAWTGWYILRPILGAGLALIAYVLLRGGLLSISSNVSNLNFLGFTGFSFMVGLFTEQTMHKLNDLADAWFATDQASGAGSNEKTQGS
jgi:hypothetical protein